MYKYLQFCYKVLNKLLVVWLLRLIKSYEIIQEKFITYNLQLVNLLILVGKLLCKRRLDSTADTTVSSKTCTIQKRWNCEHDEISFRSRSTMFDCQWRLIPWSLARSHLSRDLVAHDTLVIVFLALLNEQRKPVY